MPLKLVLASVAIASVGLVATAAASASLQFTIEAMNAYGPLTDVGATTITVFLDTPPVGGAHFRCGSAGALVPSPGRVDVRDPGSGRSSTVVAGL
jgi:hypothetical protein